MNTRHYLNLLRTFALVTLTAAAMTACSDDNDNPGGNEPLTPDGNPGIPVAFTADISPGGDANPAGTPDTRTVLTPTTDGGFTVTWKAGNDQISIWAASQQNTWAGSSYGHRYVPTTSAASSALEPYNEGEKLILPSSGEWNFTAIYGYNHKDTGKGIAFISPLTQSGPGNTEHIAKKDFSVATAQQNILDAGSVMPANISFKFKHMLSALQLQVKNETDAKLTVEEIRLSVSGDQIACQRAYDVATGKWEAGEGTKSDYLQLEIKNRAALASNATEPQKFHMLLFPEPDHSGKDMTITVITDRGEYTLTKPAPAGGFAAGKNYLTDITITSNPGTNETWTEYISTVAQLEAFRNNVNNGSNYKGVTVRLLNDIYLTGEWTPIGNEPSSNTFQGTFDGGGYNISGLNVNATAAAGLFGCVYKGTVRNLRVSGNVTSTQDVAGGIVASLKNGSIVENCIFNGTVNGNESVGGIAGENISSRIIGCYTKGSVSAESLVGGIVGDQYRATLDNCYSEATVTASIQNAGGIAGYSALGATVTHCYATGAISGVNKNGGSGGIVGCNEGTIEYCIALNPSITRTSGKSTNFGRVVGYHTGTIKNCAAYDGITLPDGITATNDASSIHGTILARASCSMEIAYTNYYFTTDKWAFDNKTTWEYLPWNKAFDNFNSLSITMKDYCISLPEHLGGSSVN